MERFLHDPEWSFEGRALALETQTVTRGRSGMHFQNETAQRKIHYSERKTDQFQSQLNDLKHENQRLKDWLEQLGELISEATPVLWVYEAPSFQRALKTARKWEARARETLRALEFSGR